MEILAGAGPLSPKVGRGAEGLDPGSPLRGVRDYG